MTPPSKRVLLRETTDGFASFDTYAQHFEAGDIVDTPDGLGFVDDRITDGTVEDMEASSDDPVYAVGMIEEADVNFYRGSELEEGEFDPDVDVDDPVTYFDAVAGHADDPLDGRLPPIAGEPQHDGVTPIHVRHAEAV